MIEIRNLTHTYMPDSPFQATAIHDVSLTIADGEFIGLIGHTGSGKSTLIQHINALLKPTNGKVLVDGEDIHAPGSDRRALRRKIGLVFQYPEHQLFEETVEKDIGFGPKNLGLSEEECKERVQEACERVGIDFERLADRSPFELSGGQMRRVAIAGVLAMRPGVLMLDEPTAGLDPAGREEILALIRSLHQEGVTVLMVSHSMDDVAQMADRIVVMHQGTIAMVGKPSEIFAHGKKLREIGLDVPETVRLRLTLQEHGIDLPDSLYTLEALTDALASQWKDGRNA
ncbi:MAG TPA: energy-coupling factor transporter ATPase [Clostridia bacterium]|nr:energy-coupling factor transporter ATPase [Clostridia bacterium]